MSHPVFSDLTRIVCIYEDNKVYDHIDTSKFLENEKQKLSMQC